MAEITPKGLANLHSYMLKKYGHIAGDRTNRYENIINNGYDSLCNQCDGTGNQLLSMYQKCEVCNGHGFLPPKPEQLEP